MGDLAIFFNAFERLMINKRRGPFEHSTSRQTRTDARTTKQPAKTTNMTAKDAHTFDTTPRFFASCYGVRWGSAEAIQQINRPRRFARVVIFLNKHTHNTRVIHIT